MASSTNFLYLLPFLWACGNQNAEPPQATPKWQARSVDCSNVIWDWTNVGQPFMMTWCTSCHHSDLDTADRQGAPSSTNFDTYASSVIHKDRIIARVLDGGSSPMPPAGVPTDAELQRLHEWLECGMME